MTQLGRNEPCRCGSGKKYKKCCLAKDDELVRERARAAREAKRKLKAEMQELNVRRAAQNQSAAPAQPPIFWLEDDLDEVSNSVLRLIAERRYDQALVTCDRLLREYPDVADGFERSALVHDALGNHSIAADFWQKAVDFVEHPDRRADYDEELIEDFRQHMNAARERAAQSAATLPAQPADQERAP